MFVNAPSITHTFMVYMILLLLSSYYYYYYDYYLLLLLLLLLCYYIYIYTSAIVGFCLAFFLQIQDSLYSMYPS